MIIINKQKEYMEKIKVILESKNVDFTYYIETFGCTLNENDSEKMEGIFELSGMKKQESSEGASLIVFNTCCIRENAEKRLLGRLGAVKKEALNGAIILIGGCMMQEKENVKIVKEKFPFVDLIFGTHTSFRLPENLYNIISSIYEDEGKEDKTEEKIKNENKKEIKSEKNASKPKRKTITDVIDIDGEIYEGVPVKRGDGNSAFVTIMYGCNNFCTYCIVPYVRGRERSRKPQYILNEIKDLVSDGYTKITLLGQNVNSYKGEGEIEDFGDLINEVCKIDGLKELSFISPHPKDFTDKIIDSIAKNDKVSRNLHYPLQSGSTRILKKMNRKYTKEQFIQRAEKIFEKVPEVSLSTDIIVGFPGETEEDFEETLDVVRKIDFDQIFMFIYSPRVGTVAYNMKDEYVPKEIQSERFERLKNLFNERLDEINEKYIGKIENVFVEGESKKDKYMLEARNKNNKILIFPKYDGWKKGDEIKIKITKNHRWYLKGEKI